MANIARGPLNRTLRYIFYSKGRLNPDILILKRVKNWLKKYKEKTLTIDLRKYNHRPYVITESFKKAIDENERTT